MSLNKVIKGREAAHEPFVMERLNGQMRKFPHMQEIEEIGGDLVSLEREAYEKGFASGEKAGFEFGRQKAEVLFNGLSGILEELANFKENLHKPCEEEMVELSLAIARKVVHREIETRRDVVLDCVRAALKSAVAVGEISIKVNPKDLDVVQQYRGDIARYAEGIKGVVIEASEGVDKGCCVIETNYGEIDATIGSAFSEIEEKLKNG